MSFYLTFFVKEEKLSKTIENLKFKLKIKCPKLTDFLKNKQSYCAKGQVILINLNTNDLIKIISI